LGDGLVAVGRVLVHVLDDNGLRVLRLDVLPGAAVAVSTSPNLEVEAAVDLRYKSATAIDGAGGLTLSCSEP
jgi:hypothetical protein